jgi:hypothetical protein
MRVTASFDSASSPPKTREAARSDGCVKVSPRVWNVLPICAVLMQPDQ